MEELRKEAEKERASEAGTETSADPEGAWEEERDPKKRKGEKTAGRAAEEQKR